MKRNSKIIFSVGLGISLAALNCSLAACNKGSAVNGPEYEYKIIDTTEEYVFTGNQTSNVIPDAEIKIDGVFDEDFYKDRKWFEGHKKLDGEDGTLEMTTYFSKTGIVVAAKIKDSRPAVYSNTVSTGLQTCFSGYFAFGDATFQADGVYEVECTVGNRFKLSRFVDGNLQVVTILPDDMPVTAVVREGDIKKGECFNYNIEYFLPYSLFDRDSRPEKIYFNPTMISATLDENGETIADLRTWYNFGDKQSSLYGWGNPNQGYAFDRNGFICNEISIQATGGSVSEEWGYDWCVTGDTVNFTVEPEAGKTLSSLTVNGEQKKDDVKDGKLSVVCNGDIDIVANFS